MYSNEERVVIWFNIAGVSFNKFEKLLSVFGLPVNIKENIFDKQELISSIIGVDYYLKLKSVTDNKIDAFIDELNKKQIKITTCYSEGFPEKLAEITPKVYILYYMGDLNLINEKAVGIVGTRKPTSYGKAITEDFAKEMAKNGVVIVSGLATGVDKIAHDGALKVKGKTIAVLAGGFDKIYPVLHTNTAKEIAQKGLLVSEYAPSVKAYKFNFPLRNRIIAAISDAVLITEAGEKSGSMHTKNYAQDYEKEVFAVPANINVENAKGSNRLIQTMQAQCALCPKDILTKLGIKESPNPVVMRRVAEDPITEMILKILSEGEMDIEVLQEKTKLEIKVLNSHLTKMSIRGLIRKLPGNMYSK